MNWPDACRADRLRRTRPIPDSFEPISAGMPQAGATGGYYAGGQPAEVSELAKNSKLARRLWAVSAQALVNRRLATLNEMIAFG
jgi:hypothetical protein